MGSAVYEKCNAYINGFCFLKGSGRNRKLDCPADNGVMPEELHRRIKKFVFYLTKKRWDLGGDINSKENMIRHKCLGETLEIAIKILVHGIDGRKSVADGSKND